MNDKFHKNAEIKKKLAQSKIVQMKDGAIKEIRNASIKIAVDSAKKVISQTEPNKSKEQKNDKEKNIKTVQEIDREKLEKKFSKPKKAKLN